MGLIPATGTAIQMGRVRNAYGLSGAVRLRADLGAQIGITTGQIRLSTDFGGRTTPFNY
jgi:ribosomal 30S subunit maturation factor RimM